ncbi:MAG: lamin tail domain-containing protein [Bacteroidetes bacterium]|nr:lamin tail domain-containing protein [Bacteroidota bacterium]
MQKKILILFIFIGQLVHAQVSDDFSDGNFTSNPTWLGDDSLYTVTNQMLQSNCQTTNKSFYLATTSATSSNSEWRLWMNLKFQTSSTNYVDFYIIADNQDLLGSINGYYVRVGNTKDEICLYRKDGSAATLLIDGTDGRSEAGGTDNTILLKITRDAAGLFVLQSDITGTGNSLVAEGSVTDNTYLTCSYMGIVTKQSTSSFFNKHYFDDVYAGPIIVDLTPPTLVSATALDSLNLDVLFSEALNANTSQVISNFLVDNGIGSPTVALLDNGNKALVHLQFNNKFVNNYNHILSVSGITDLAGNTMVAANTNFVYSYPVLVSNDDIIISEIMADPEGSPGLPNAEYVELTNRSNKTLNLQDFILSDLSSSSGPMSNYILLPDSHVIVCSSTLTNLFIGITSNVIGVSNMPSLNNSGDKISVADNSGNIINSVTYADTWYQDPVKGQGGYSLERIDREYLCIDKNNWRASNSLSGGTPGQLNSVDGTFTDPEIPLVDYARIITPDMVEIFFKKPMSASTLTQLSNYQCSQGIGAPIALINTNPIYTLVTLKFSQAFQPGIIYYISFSNLTDCPGKPLLSANVRVGVPENATNGDLVINEILFNPAPDYVDFVELYNNSNKVIDLSSLYIANARTDTPLVVSISQISTERRSIFPNEHLCITENPTSTAQYYQPPAGAHISLIPDLPTYNDDEGICIIYNLQLQMLDSIYYSDKFHYSLLSDVEGVSLERLSYTRPSNDSTNWHSAASNVRYATPGYTNSQRSDVQLSSQNIITYPEIFSPDNDGYNDVLNITYQFEETGQTLNMTIYNSNGIPVINLLENKLIGNNGTLSWDGTDLNNEKATMGIYVLYTEVFRTNGKVEYFKNAFVLGGKF